MSSFVGGVGGAIIGGALIGGAGDVIGSALSSHGAQDAAQTQAQATQYAADLQHQQYEQQRDDQAPWRQAGTQALSQMQDPSFQHQFSMSDFHADPGYQFNLEQGQQALERSAAARGGLQTGGTLKALTGYAQGMASNEYQNAYNRFTNNQTTAFNRLASIAGTGQTANGQLSQAGTAFANNAGNIATAGANAQGAASIAQGQIWGNTLSGLAGSAGNAVSQYGMMNRFAPQAPMSSPAGGGGGGGFGGGFNMSGDNTGGFQMPAFE